jgi:cell division septal protein FtsQ
VSVAAAVGSRRRAGPEGLAGVLTGRRVAIVVGVAALAACVAVLSRASITVSSVKVSGLKHMTAAEVIRVSGVKTGARIGPAEGELVRKELLRTRAFVSVSVIRGLTGTLHIHVRERRPVAWCRPYGCALAADGTLLYRLGRRDPAWPSLSGMPASEGTVGDPATVADALKGDGLVRGAFGEGEVTWRRVGPSAWVLEAGKKRVTVSSPVREVEFKRLMRFQRDFPDAWARARALDLRFADRVVAKR